MTTYRELKDRWDRPIYTSGMDHPSYRYLLDEAIAERGHGILSSLLFPPEANLSEMTIIGQSMIGQPFDGVNLRRTRFVDCTISSCDFTKAVNVTTQFYGCAILASNFSIKDGFGLTFAGSSFSNCQFVNANVVHMTFRHCRSYGENDWTGARLNFASHEQLAMVLSDAATTEEQTIIANYPLIFGQNCWRDFNRMDISADLREWVVRTLLPYAEEYGSGPWFFSVLLKKKDRITSTMIHDTIAEWAEDDPDSDDDYDGDDDDDEDEDEDDDA